MNRNLILTAFLSLAVSIVTAQQCQNDSTGMIPISDLGSNIFNGMTGGLYANGSNTMPPAHLSGGLNMASQIQPLDLNGNPDPGGRIAFISIGMSNANMYFTAFRDSALNYPQLNPEVNMINCAVGSKDIDNILDTTDSYWTTVSQRIAFAQASPLQVQAVWFLQAKHVSGIPPGQGIAHLDTMERKFLDAFRLLKIKFPNLKQIFCSGRDYGGYSNPGSGNPEPYAYYTGWSFRKLVERQINNDPVLEYTSTGAEVPWLGWSNYIWADGSNLRSDGFNWLCPQDFQPDGVHPSAAGRAKVSGLLMNFFRNDTIAHWFRIQSPTGINDLPNASQNELLIYPNPAADVIQIYPRRNESFEYEVFNSSGKLILKGSNRTEINIRHLRSGFYWIRITSPSQTTTGKFVKE